MNPSEMISTALEGTRLILRENGIEFDKATTKQHRRALETFLKDAGPAYVAFFKIPGAVSVLADATKEAINGIKNARDIIKETSLNIEDN